MFYVPEIEKNLISISQLIKTNNINVLFYSFSYTMNDKTMGKVLLLGRLKDVLYHFESLSQPSLQNHFPARALLSKKTKELVAFKLKLENFQIWHRRLGHLYSRILSKILNSCNEKFILNEKSFYDSCQLGKSHLLPYSLSQSHARVPLELIHTNVWGSAPLNSLSG